MGRPRVSKPTMTEQGYIYVTGPDGTRILEHRLVAEQLLGRKLQSNEKVMHEDGNRANNDPANLLMVQFVYTPLLELVKYESRRV